MKAPDLMRGFFYIDVTSHLYEEFKKFAKVCSGKRKGDH